MLGSRTGVAPVIVALLGVLVGGLVFAGCQSNPEPPPLKETESPSPSPTPSTSPTEAAPTLPPEAEGADEAAAKAFVRHYVDLVNHAMRTGDTATLTTLGTSRCQSCMAVIENIHDLYRSGGHLEGAGWQITQLGVLRSDRGGETVVQAGVLVQPQTRYESASAEPQRFEGGQQVMTFHLARKKSDWVVRRWSQTT